MNGEFLDLGSEKIYAEVQKINRELMSMADNVSKVNSKGLTLTPSGSNDAIKKLNADLAAQDKLIQQLQSKLVQYAQRQEANANKIVAAKEKERLAEIKLAQSREKSVDAFTKREAREQAALAKAESLYNKVQAKVNSLSATYNNLATKRELGLKLSTREEAQLKSLTDRLNKYQSVLIKVNTDVQKYGPNVGNYASHWNGLGNALNQLTREAPSFANSLQTGFMALSNNIPMLVDEINNLKIKNQELAAQGQPTKSALSSIGAALFSWQTALSLGVTILTVYGDEIINFASDLIKGSKAIDATKESMKQLNEARVEGAKAAQDELIALKANLEVAKDVNLPLKEREIAVDNLLKQYPFYFENLTKEQILAGQTKDAEKELTDALIARSTALAAIDKITANASRIIDIKEEERDLNKELLRTEKALETIRKNVTSGAGQGAAGLTTQQSQLRIRLSSLKEERESLEAVNERMTTYAVQNQKVAIGLDYQAEKQKKATKAKREDIEAIKLQEQSLNGFLIELEKNKKVLEELQSGSGSRVEFDAFQKIIDEYNTVIKLIREGSQELKDSAKNAADFFAKIRQDGKLTAEEMEFLRKSVNSFLSAFDSNLLSQFGFKSLEVFTTIEENGRTAFENLLTQATETGQSFGVAFNAITEVAQDAFNFIEQLQQQQFQNQLNRLGQERDVAIAFAGESAGAREEIERQYDARRRQIARQQAEAQKRQALFNIALNTAQGITAALASVPPNVPLSIAIGVIGLAQAALVASQPVPQFKDGGKHKGGLMMVNDGAGSNYREIIKTPDGKISMPEGRNVIMDAPAGTEIFNASKSRQMLDNILMANGISYAKPNGGVTREDIKNGMIDAIATMPQGDSITWSIDSRGEAIYRNSQNRYTRLMNNKKTFTAKRIGR